VTRDNPIFPTVVSSIDGASGVRRPRKRQTPVPQSLIAGRIERQAGMDNLTRELSDVNHTGSAAAPQPGGDKTSDAIFLPLTSSERADAAANVVTP
jgi:hypothetical protein